jgi:hypothetical protein
MLFPSDPAKAESFCAAHLMKGPLQNYLQAGHTLSAARQIALFNARDREIFSKEIEARELHGQRIGEVVRILWGLICSLPAIASWDCAIRVVKERWARDGIKTSRANLRAHLSELRPALHLWGALALREYQWLDDPNVGYHRIDDVVAFMTEAMTLLQRLRVWRDGRNEPVLAGDVFGPWVGWEPHEPRPGWPRTGGINRISFPSIVQIPVRRPPGRPPRP